MRPTRAVIHTDNFRSNIRLVRSFSGPTREICVAVKADGYGHGAVPLSRIALEEGASRLAVATIGEAAELRNAGFDVPVLLFGLTAREEFSDIVDMELEPFVADVETVKALSDLGDACGKIPKVHLKIDTGMGRIGCTPEEAVNIAGIIAESPSLKLAGICTHFPAADSDDLFFTGKQIKIFSHTVKRIKAAGINPGLVHAANSGAVIGCSDALFDMVRPGIMLYGYYPSRKQKRTCHLKPVMELKSKIVFLKRVTPGTTISYGRTWTAGHETVIATIPAGYADGYNRLLSGCGSVAVNGKAYPVVGRVCMDQFMIDLGPDSKIALGDDVILFGPEKPAPSAEDIATAVKSIAYEVTCRIDKRVPRVYC